MKSTCSIFSTKVSTSPPSWQPKQYQACFSWETLKEGVRSEWKGQRPLWSRPLRASRT